MFKKWFKISLKPEVSWFDGFFVVVVIMCLGVDRLGISVRWFTNRRVVGS
jgi:hypothetical protein